MNSAHSKIFKGCPRASLNVDNTKFFLSFFNQEEYLMITLAILREVSWFNFAENNADGNKFEIIFDRPIKFHQNYNFIKL